MQIRKRYMYLWNKMPLSGNKVQKAIFSVKVKVNVTRSKALVSFKMALLVELLYILHAEMKSLSHGF